MAKSKFWRLIDGYDTSGGASVGKSFTDLSYSGAVKQKRKRGAAFRIAALTLRISNLFSYTSTKSYGALSLSFGILTLILHFSGEYFGAYKDAGVAALIIGIVFSMLSIPLLLIDRPISIFLQDFAITDFILFEFFCIKRSHRVDDAPSMHPVVAICLGVVPALLGFFAPIQTVLIVLGLLIFVYISFISPEFSYLSAMLCLPYISHIPYAEYLFFGVLLVTLVSFLRKVVYGKRVFHFEKYDLVIGFFMLAVLISGVFVKGFDSFTGSLGIIVLSLGYMLTSNIVANRRLADCAISAFVLSSMPAAAASVYEALVAFISGEAYTVFSAGIGASFGDPRAYAAFLIIVIPFVLMRAAEARGVRRFLYTLLIILNTAALVFTAERFAWLVIFIGVLLYFAHKAKYAAPLIVILLMALPYGLIFFLGDSVAILFTGGGATLLPSRIGELWQAAIEVLSRNLLVGIGIGEGCFAEEFAPLGFAGIGNSHNFFIELGLEAGIFALVAILLLLVVRFRHRVMYQRYLKESDMAFISTVATIATSSLIVLGATYYVFENMEITYLFWFIFGLGSAALRVAKRERDDKILYYEDTKSPDFSVAEIKIK